MPFLMEYILHNNLYFIISKINLQLLGKDSHFS